MTDAIGACVLAAFLAFMFSWFACTKADKAERRAKEAERKAELCSRDLHKHREWVFDVMNASDPLKEKEVPEQVPLPTWVQGVGFVHDAPVEKPPVVGKKFDPAKYAETPVIFE